MKHVALVAGLTLGCVASAAEAATLDYNVSVSLKDVGAVTGTIRTDHKAGVLSKSNIISYDIFFGGVQISSSNPGSNFSVSGDSLFAINNLIQFHFDGSASNILMTSRSGVLQFAAGSAAITPFYEGFQYMGFDSRNEVNTGTVLTIGTSDGFVSAVPLPASAPMFGVALIGLAGICYAARRKKATATA